MSWRIQDHILRGEIDNRTRGRVTGRLWLDGLADPMLLDLAGDCEPDLAGCLVRFTNPQPVPLTTRRRSLHYTRQIRSAVAAAGPVARAVA